MELPKADAIAKEAAKEGEAFEEQRYERQQQEHADAEEPAGAPDDGEPAPAAAGAPDDGEPAPADSPDEFQVSQVSSSGFAG